MQLRNAEQHLWKPKVSNLGDGLQLQETPLVPLLSAKNRNTRLRFTQTHHNWTTEDWTNLSWSDESQRSDGQSRIRCKQHGGMDPSHLVSRLQAAADGVMGGTFLAHFGPLSTNWRSLKGCSLPESYCWPHCNHLASSSRIRSPQLLSGTWQWVHCMKWRGSCCLGEHRYRLPVKNGALNGGPRCKQQMNQRK